MFYQTDKHGKLLHNMVLNYEPIRIDYSPFALDNVNFLHGLKRGWGTNIVNVDGTALLTPEQCLDMIIEYMGSVDFLNIIRKYIVGDLFPIDAQETIEYYLKFEREFQIIDKTKLNEVLQKPHLINSILTTEERNILQEQAYKRFIIDDINKPLTTSQLTDVVKYNLYFYDKFPTYENLLELGIIDQIKEYIENSSDINYTQIQEFIQQALNDKLNSHVFLPFDLINEVILKPNDVGKLLTKEQFVSTLYRAASNLSFISLDDIHAVESAYDKKQLYKILNVFNTSEIKLIMENELNEKKIISNMLTFDQVSNYFNTLKQEFLTNNTNQLDTIDITYNQIDIWINEANIIY